MTNATTATKSRIPEISNEKLLELSYRIVPVVRMARVRTRIERTKREVIFHEKLHRHGKWRAWDKGHLFEIKRVDLRRTSFLWNPRPRCRVDNLQPICDITTYHTFGYVGFFKPSIAEVLAQIPEKYLPVVVAFELVSHPYSMTEVRLHPEALCEGYHVAKVRLYASIVDPCTGENVVLPPE
ncbi:MAG: hypothetical protein P4M11_12900 [Candidatus Pacebacteria bacterium]|nr:hypothetical protein [Candidatus Paceibacterota bacterium]